MCENCKNNCDCHKKRVEELSNELDNLTESLWECPNKINSYTECFCEYCTKIDNRIDEISKELNSMLAPNFNGE